VNSTEWKTLKMLLHDPRWLSVQMHENTWGLDFEPVGRGFESLRARQ